MSYMQDLEARLEVLLAQEPDAATLTSENKKITLESYRNGQKAGAPGKRASAGKAAEAAPADH